MTFRARAATASICACHAARLSPSRFRTPVASTFSPGSIPAPRRRRHNREWRRDLRPLPRPVHEDRRRQYSAVLRFWCKMPNASLERLGAWKAPPETAVFTRVSAAAAPAPTRRNRRHPWLQPLSDSDARRHPGIRDRVGSRGRCPALPHSSQ